VEDQKARADYRRQRRKAHLGVDAKTLDIRAIEITDNAIGDAPMLPYLLPQIPEDEPLCSVSADGAYDTKVCHAAIAARQAAATIPTRRNARPSAEMRAGARTKNEILKATRELGRSIWTKWSSSHRRCLVETRMGVLQKIRRADLARDFERQVTGLLVQVSTLNGFTQLGTPETARLA
jgi:hypothetical protein